MRTVLGPKLRYMDIHICYVLAYSYMRIYSISRYPLMRMAPTPHPRDLKAANIERLIDKGMIEGRFRVC